MPDPTCSIYLYTINERGQIQGENQPKAELARIRQIEANRELWGVAPATRDLAGYPNLIRGSLWRLLREAFVEAAHVAVNVVLEFLRRFVDDVGLHGGEETGDGVREKRRGDRRTFLYR